ncbi:hypothetical protein LTR53_019878, partial [Teratosphaeriaceae sp. CCFEE 6253]
TARHTRRRATLTPSSSRSTASNINSSRITAKEAHMARVPILPATLISSTPQTRMPQKGSAGFSERLAAVSPAACSAGRRTMVSWGQLRAQSPEAKRRTRPRRGSTARSLL